MFKINSHFFDITSKVLLTKFDQNSTTKSKVIHVRISIPNDVWVKSSKTKAIVQCQTKFHQIWISKSKVLHLQIPVPKWEKTKKWEKLFWLTKRDNKGITDPGRSLGIANQGKMDYRWEQL